MNAEQAGYAATLAGSEEPSALAGAESVVRVRATCIGRFTLLRELGAGGMGAVLHRALLRGLSAEPDKRFPSMGELLSVLALERGDQSAGNTKARNRLLFSFVTVAAISTATLQSVQAQRSLNPRDMFRAAFLVLVTTLLIGIVFRKTLRENRFHRCMWLVFLIHMTESSLHRWIALRMGVSISVLFPIEMVVLAATGALAGIFLIPRLRWIWTLPLAAAALSLWNLAPLRILSVIYILVVILMTLGWMQGTRRL